MEFAAAAQEWTELLRDAAQSAFAKKHEDVVLRLAVALACAQDLEDAIDYDAISAHCESKADEQVLLSFAFVIKRLLDVIIRDHMRFLLPENQISQSEESSASQKNSLVQQQALLRKIPGDFQQAFLETLRANWDTLEDAAHKSKFSLPRLSDMQWTIVPPNVVVVRIQTSDGQSRTMQVPMRQFHQLRFNAAKVLQEMNQVEAHPVMRLTRTEQTHGHARTANIP
ncbi:hypothetical protein Gpo141_00004908 [Globisporangium polare]